MQSELAALYQDLIIDHGINPRNFKLLAKPSHQAEGYNPLCGDQIKVFLQMDTTVTDIGIQGTGCAICMASASLMSEAVAALDAKAILGLFDKVQVLLTSDSQASEDLGKLLALSNVKAYPSRVKCAALAWHTLKAALHQQQQISTE